MGLRRLRASHPEGGAHIATYMPVDFALARGNWVYRFWDVHGEALYVGKSSDTLLMQRMAQHLTTLNPTHRKPWAGEVARVDAAPFETAEAAAAEEQRMIKRLNPKYNKAGKLPRGVQTLAGMEW